MSTAPTRQDAIDEIRRFWENEDRVFVRDEFRSWTAEFVREAFNSWTASHDGGAIYVTAEESRRMVRKYLSHLTCKITKSSHVPNGRHRQILNWRSAGLTYRRIAEVLEVSVERARQLDRQAMRLLTDCAL